MNAYRVTLTVPVAADCYEHAARLGLEILTAKTEGGKNPFVTVQRLNDDGDAIGRAVMVDVEHSMIVD